MYINTYMEVSVNAEVLSFECKCLFCVIIMSFRSSKICLNKCFQSKMTWMGKFKKTFIPSNLNF